MDSFFLGKPKSIKIRGEEIKVWRLRGTDDFYVDEQGRFISWRWQPKAQPKTTPFQRAQETWSPEEGVYVTYERGLASAWRARRLALFGAWKKRLPKVEQILALIEEDTREQFFRARPLRPENLSPKIKEKLREAGFVFIKARKPELKEVNIKILFLCKDIKNRLNVGALLARATAITDRLRERLQGIYSWVGEYSGHVQFLGLMQQQADRLFKKIDRETKILSRHAFYSKGAIRTVQAKALIDKIVSLENLILNLKPLRPYGRWSEMMILDFQEAIKAVREKDYGLGRVLLMRIRLSIEIKRQQREMDRFLLALEQDAILGRWREDEYRRWLDSMIGIFQKLGKEEAKVIFREPVCGVAVAFLLQAREMLRSKNFTDLNEAVRQVYVLL